MLASPSLAHVEVTARMGEARLAVVRRHVELRGEPGELVSLLAVHGPARSVTTEGLAYPLSAETLLPGSSRGVSNVLVARRATVSLADGVLLAIQPGPPASLQEDLPC